MAKSERRRELRRRRQRREKRLREAVKLPARKTSTARRPAVPEAAAASDPPDPGEAESRQGD